MHPDPSDLEKPIAELEGLITELRQIGRDSQALADAQKRGIDIEAEIAKLEGLREEKLRQIFSDLSPWNEVQMARHKNRPYTLDYIRLIFDDFLELHGDRVNADDPAIVGGFAKLVGQPVVVMGHQKGRDLKERQLRNFGSARPAGFRKALRLMKMAEKFQKPLLVFVDTPAAEANLPAEEEGVSTTIAVCLREMVGLTIPIVVTVIGEGGSGGALAIAVGDRIAMLEHSIYSVIPPEGCAAILWNDRNRAADAAEALKLTARHAHEFGLVDEVLSEPLGGAHRDASGTAATIKQSLLRNLAALQKLTPEELIATRYEKFKRMGRWVEP